MTALDPEMARLNRSIRRTHSVHGGKGSLARNSVQAARFAVPASMVCAIRLHSALEALCLLRTMKPDLRFHMLTCGKRVAGAVVTS